MSVCVCKRVKSRLHIFDSMSVYFASQREEPSAYKFVYAGIILFDYLFLALHSNKFANHALSLLYTQALMLV